MRNYELRARSIKAMDYSENSFNYFELESFPWLLFAFVSLFVFKPVAVVLHEVGHLIPAFFLTSGTIKVRIGESRKQKVLKLGRRIELFFSLDFSGLGSTTHNESSIPKFYEFFIIMGGPLLSIMVTTISGIILLSGTSYLWLEVVIAGFLCSNFLIFLRSAIPIHLKPSKNFPEAPPSDGLQLLRLLRGRN